MKVTDYAPRAAPFDSYLMTMGADLVGVEVGVDVGAHARAMLTYCGIRLLWLVDPWANPRMHGYCEGSLAVLGFGARVRIIPKKSVEASTGFADSSLDFAYIDQEHGADSVTADLRAWWPKIKPGGVLGYRNYSDTKTPLSAAVDAFVAAHRDIDAQPLSGEIILVKAE